MDRGKNYIFYAFPVLLSFFVMSFCDLVGIGVDNARADFGLNNTLAQLIPMAVFGWFFLLSVPVGVLQERIGKRNMLNIGMILTATGLILPFILYSFPVLMLGFALLGIGNTIIQVSANPLLIDVVPSERASSFLSFSQFVKAVGSMAAPYLATFFAVRFGNWGLLLLVFGVISMLSALLLHQTHIRESRSGETKATMQSCLKLLNTRYMLLMVLGIFFIVGMDVGINSTSGQFLMEKIGMDPEPAKQGRSLYFLGKMTGTFLGAVILTRLSPKKFFLFSSLGSLVAVLVFILSTTPVLAISLMFAIGLISANIFPLIFSITVKRQPDRANEISGLMIMAVSGGALIPPLVGRITDLFQVSAAMFIFIVCAAYLLFLSVYVLKRQ